MTPTQVTFATLFTGAALGQGGALIQRFWQRRDDAAKAARARTEALEDARQANIDRACREMLDAQAQARLLLQHATESDALPTALFEISERLDTWSVFIPEKGLRDQIEDLAGMIWWADKISAIDGEHEAQAIAWRIANHVGYVAGALLRREAPPEIPALLRRWRAVWLGLQDALTK